MINIAIDGPGGAGKSSVAKYLAKELGYIYVDTGALYRTIGYHVLQNGISTGDTERIVAELKNISLSLKFEGRQIVLLNGNDIGDFIRTPEVSMAASKVSAIPEVRAFLLETQRNIAKQNNVIMDGRDIGTVILPNADLKIFLIASPAARAARRLDELKYKGIETTFEQVLAEMNERDKNDSTRESAPLKKADDAILLDNSDLSMEETANRILEELKKKETLKKNIQTYDRLKRRYEKAVKRCFHVKVEGLENVPANAGYLVCGNHIGARDVLIIAAALPHQIRFVAKKELFSVPLIGRVIRKAGAVEIDRTGNDVAAIRTSIDLLKSKESVAIFPQGHRNPGVAPQNTKIHNGAALIAYRSNADVLPVNLCVKGFKYGLFKKVTLKIGKVISHSELGFEKGGNTEYEKATGIIWNEILALDPNVGSNKV